MAPPLLALVPLFLALQAPIPPASAAQRVVLKVWPGALPAVRDQLGTNVRHLFPTPGGIDRVGIARIVVAEGDAGTIASLRSSGLVAWAEPLSFEGGLAGTAAPDDPWFPGQWALDQESDLDLGLPEAWAKQGGFDLDDALVVAVLDSGHDVSSSVGEWSGTFWSNPGEIAGNGIDDDGNGLIDDVHGYDFVEDDGDPDADNVHGIHVASICTARANNGEGLAGVASGARLMVLKAFDGGGSFPSSGPYPGHLAAATALLYAVDHGADVINNSWHNGIVPSPVINDAIDYAIDNGVHVVFAAANFGVDEAWPPEHPDVIAVAGVDSDGVRGDWGGESSNFGSWVDLAAGGTSIITTGSDGSLSAFSGTSAASPLVTGAVAHLVQARPQLAPHEMRTLLALGARSVDAQNPGFEGLLGAGFPSIPASLELLEPVDDLGRALAGSSNPVLNGWSGMLAGEVATLSLHGAPPSARAMLVIGHDVLGVSYLGGILMPSSDFVFPFESRPDGTASWDFVLPADLDGGPSFVAQVIVADAGAARGAAFSNALRLAVD